MDGRFGWKADIRLTVTWSTKARVVCARPNSFTDIDKSIMILVNVAELISHAAQEVALVTAGTRTFDEFSKGSVPLGCADLPILVCIQQPNRHRRPSCAVGLFRRAGSETLSCERGKGSNDKHRY